MPIVQRITPFLWFDSQAEEAAKFYTSIFKNSKITATARYGEVGRELHQKLPGTILTVGFELEGLHFTALNGGPQFKFNESVSFVVHCDTQEEVDYYWEKLGDGGNPNVQQCGWLKDKFGLSWQIIPSLLPKMLADPDPAKSQCVMQVVMRSKKFSIAELERAFGEKISN